ncbi:RNI-like protein [Tothia fuscella]|uniref:RNI-like protein n=1 Tax=Tothia fuscella TaxID=1048955 RepID=A0A9P4U032_9PEZI|nr:RNI-like protein [Tothia fuscella]
MRSRGMSRRYSDGANSVSSASTSPERDIDDDNESFMMQQNDSQSSLALSIPDEELSDSLAREIAERSRVSPISRLPAELMIAIFQKLPSSKDLKNCMLVSREWSRNSVGLLWHRPATSKWDSLHNVVQSIRSAHAFFDYPHLVKRLNLSSLGSQVSDGTLAPFEQCNRIERLTLTNCTKLTDLSVAKMVNGNRSLLALDVTCMEGVTDVTMEAVANNCFRLQGLNITSCRKVTDDSLVQVARSCRHLKRLKFNDCRQLTAKSIIAFADNCRQLLEIDLHGCSQVEDDAVTALINEGPNLRELRLAHCTRLTDSAFLNLPRDIKFESLRILDLTDCTELQDSGVQKVIEAAPRLRNLVLAKCRQITDRAVVAITKLGKNLHYIHLGHCARITDAGVIQLVKHCTRIRYIDLACCQSLTDTSITQLATLPKLKRIGLVKCGNITDRSVYALAKKPIAEYKGQPTSSSLERVHLSYCVNLTLPSISALLNNCPRLTHLSLTGVQAFLHDEFTVFCRPAPDEFNDHQRDVFCVFSGTGVSRLRDYLRTESQSQPYETEGTMYDDEQSPQLQDMQQFPPLPPPPPPAPPAPPLHQAPFSQHPQQQHLPPLTIPAWPQTGEEQSPNAMSPTHDAPLSLEDEDFEGSDIMAGPEPAPEPPHSPQA